MPLGTWEYFWFQTCHKPKNLEDLKVSGRVWGVGFGSIHMYFCFAESLDQYIDKLNPCQTAPKVGKS